MKTTSMLNASWDDLVNMPRDNGEFADFWYIVDGHTLTICEQKVGEQPIQKIQIPLAIARKIIRALTKEYPVKREKVTA